MALGYLLARAGVRAVVLEKHADFLRDFRGDTVHPSTLEIMYELGLLESFLNALKVLRRLTFLRRLPARIFGVGFHPEHVHRALRAKTLG